jgi:hypothetical protein
MDNQSKLFAQIKETMHQAFWDTLSSDLSENPPKYKHVIVLLNEIKIMLKQLVPNRKDIHKDIDEYIDVNFIEQMIVNDAFDYKELENLIRYVVAVIQKLQCPAEDKDTNEFLEKIVNMCREKKSWKDIIPYFLKTSYTKIEKIQDGVNDFKIKMKEINKKDNKKVD